MDMEHFGTATRRATTGTLSYLVGKKQQEGENLVLVISTEPGSERPGMEMDLVGASSPQDEEAVRDWLTEAVSGTLPLAAHAAEWFGRGLAARALQIDSTGLNLLSRLDSARMAGTQLLLFYRQPETAVLRALAAGADPVVALQNWIDNAHCLLRLFRRNRARSLVVSLEAARARPAILQAFCREKKLGFGPEPDVAYSIDGEQESGASEAHKLLAVQMSTQSEAVRELRMELEACAVVPGTEFTLEIDCEKARKEILVSPRETPEPESVTTVREENELLLLQLHQMQEELETYYRKLQQEADKHQRRATEAEQATKQRDVLQQKLAHLADNNLRLKERMVFHIHRLENAQDAMRAVHRSWSWRLTRPLRFVRWLVVRKTAAERQI